MTIKAGDVPGGEDAKTDWIGRAFRMSRAQGAAIVAVTLGLSWTATYLLGGAGRIAPHWFYVPIMLAAVRFGVLGTVLTAVAAGLLAGPLMPLHVATGMAQPHSDWTSRGGFFLANGLIMAFVIGRLKATLGRELDVAQAKRDLDRHKEAVIQTVSHEFRTPLTIIRGTVDLLAEPGFVSEKAQPLVEGLERATQRMENLIKLVLAAAGMLVDQDHKRDESIALEGFCRGIADAAQEVGGSSRISFEAGAGAEVVVCDPQLLALALHAVIDNALYFSPPDDPVDITARRLAGVVEVRVRDRGRGMSESALQQAFDAFVQRDESVTREKQGLGLGLFSARKTAELLGGSLQLRAGAEGGIEAILTIPQ